MMPKFIEMANQMNNLAFGSVDCDDNRTTAKLEKVDVYPTF